MPLLKPEKDKKTMQHPRVVLLTGAPGVGKTTAIQRVSALLRQGGIAAAQCELRGFVTREVRGAGGQREGFEAVLCSTGRAVLMAHESKVSNHAGRLPRVSKYVVDVPTFESAVLPELQLPSATGLVKTHYHLHSPLALSHHVPWQWDRTRVLSTCSTR
jgi:nucleoside-triphosphatase THEP1